MEVFLTREGATVPEFATEGSACFDLKACFGFGDKVVAYNPANKKLELPVRDMSSGPVIQVHPMTRVLVPTGLIFDIPEQHVLKVFIRSSMALKNGISLANSTGIIDSDYTEETFIMILNNSDIIMNIFNGDRIAQAMLEKTETYTLTETKEPIANKKDRVDGLGSTGI